MKKALIGHLACALTYIIFGINIVACRDIAIDATLSPMVLFSMRALLAGLLFWGASLMWLVDAIFEYVELGAGYFEPAPADMLVESAAEIIRDVIFTVRERTGSAEPAHDRA